MTDAVEDQA